MTTTYQPDITPKLIWIPRVLAIVQGLFGLALLVGGVRLATLGGSWMYVLIGAGYLSGAWLLWRNRIQGAQVSLATFLVVAIWSLFEAGFHYWPQVPRLVVPALLAMLTLVLTPVSLRPTAQARNLCWPTGALLFFALLATLAAAFFPHGVITPSHAMRRSPATALGASDWTHYGHNAHGTRFAPFDQITPANVDRLKVAWTYRTGDTGPGEDQNVPLQIGNTLYTCSRNDHIAALDADTGKVRWTFDPKATSPFWQRCRGLGYYADPSATTGSSPAHCARRLFNTTNDARLIAIDAQDGKLCESFGTKGTVNLLDGLGLVKPGFYLPTSAPLVARNMIIVGGFIADNQEVGEPSGVVRAYDVATGALVWAWDLGNPEITKEPPPGQTYTRGTPNMWTTASADEKLGLVYLPLGNATPDYYGALRTKESEAFSSSIVAVDLDTGKLRWKVQTVHHDLWDYDLPSQPSLIDLPDGNGGIVPALLQPTKRGQLFLLNRQTGQALAQIAEKPVPQAGQVPEEWLAKTQPYSVGMPSIGTEPLSEARMWGATPLDQLWCRIRFRQLRYEGEFTPPGLVGSIQYPGNFGGMNWGSASVDPVNGYAYMNDTRMPILVQLMPPAQAKIMLAKLGGLSAHGPAMQEGTPYGVSVGPMLSPLGVPCNEPPFGTLSAVDLHTRKVVWQAPLGTVEDTGPLGIVSHLKMPVGMPTIGGTTTTAGGLVFFAGSQDFYIRAFDTATGKEVWKARMPVGSGSTPMSYISPISGKQYILISSGGTRQSPVRGDYVIAYALDGKP